MPNFPRTEGAVLRLVHDLSSGLRTRTDIFPVPPISPDDLDKLTAAFNAAHDAGVVATAAARNATASKNQALAALVKAAKSSLRYAENTAQGDAAKLQLLGWNTPREPNGSLAPDQVDVLVITSEGKGTVSLSWGAALTGGTPSGFRIQRRKGDGTGDWSDVGATTATTITLTGQDTGVAFEYHVVAFNKVGDAPASNIVRAVL